MIYLERFISALAEHSLVSFKTAAAIHQQQQQSNSIVSKTGGRKSIGLNTSASVQPTTVSSTSPPVRRQLIPSSLTDSDNTQSFTSSSASPASSSSSSSESFSVESVPIFDSQLQEILHRQKHSQSADPQEPITTSKKMISREACTSPSISGWSMQREWVMMVFSKFSTLHDFFIQP
jgi:hypothetical protein